MYLVGMETLGLTPVAIPRGTFTPAPLPSLQVQALLL